MTFIKIHLLQFSFGNTDQFGPCFIKPPEFQVKQPPESKHGKFHNRESYIVLNTTEHPQSGQLRHASIHYWPGQETTADEMGHQTAGPCTILCPWSGACSEMVLTS